MRYSFEDIEGQVVIVTGSGRGIGRETAKVFAAHGAKVVVSDLDKDVCQEAAEEVAKEGGEVLPIAIDVTKKEQVDTMVKQVVEKWKRIDCLVNNAGITKDSSFLRMPLADWEFILGVNVTGPFLCSSAVVTHMRKARKGSIINVSSMSRGGNPGQTNYAAAKAGVEGLTRSLAKELGPMGIRVNCVAPGFIKTRLTAAIPEKLVDLTTTLTPMKRVGETAEIAWPVLFLASKMSSYISGLIMDINGGIGSL